MFDANMVVNSLSSDLPYKQYWHEYLRQFWSYEWKSACSFKVLCKFYDKSASMLMRQEKARDQAQFTKKMRL